MEKLIVYENKKYLRISLVFNIIVIWLARLPDLSAGWRSIIFAVWAVPIVFVLYSLLNKKARLVINDEGITYRSLVTGKLIAARTDITGIEEKGSGYVIHLTDAAAARITGSAGLHRPFLKYLHKKFRSPFFISTFHLNCDKVALQLMMEGYV